MGHERIGMLPKTRRWRAIIAEVAANDAESTFQITNHTLDALGRRYNDLASDQNVEQAFAFLVDLARSAHQPNTDALNRKTPLALVSNLAETLKGLEGSLETRELVQRAAADALALWYRENHTRQSDLFESESHANPWQGLGTGTGFCELSRLYFARLTERYLNYFLDREASAVLPNLSARTEFQRKLHEHVADVSRLSFESAKITQSYAAGWFNKHAIAAPPTTAQKRKFLSYAFHKLRQEFRREGNQ
jgi:hypothetical protein